MYYNKPCLEMIIADANVDDSAMAALRGLHVESNYRVSSGVPIPDIPCPMRRCPRSRVVEFLKNNRIVTCEDGNQVDCPMDTPEAVITRSVVNLDQPPEPPAPFSLAG